MNVKNFANIALPVVALSVVLAGCGPDPVANATAPAGSAPTLQPFVPKAEAGIRREPGDPTELITKAKAQPFDIRANPFALRSEEIAFDRSQAVASLTEGQGWYSFIAEEKQEATTESPIFEPQPSRRLAGILIGETVAALIDMGEGKGLQTIRPGQMIGGAGDKDWTVQSIDEEKAVLRRNDSSKRPQFVVVRLEDSSTMGNSGGGATGTTGGTTGGGGRAQDGRGQSGTAD